MSDVPTPAAVTDEASEKLILTLDRLLDEALKAMEDALKLLGDGTAKDAVEFIGDWLNGRDVDTDREASAAYVRWNERGNP